MLRTLVVTKPLVSGILLSTCSIFVLRTVVVDTPLIPGILFLKSPIFYRNFVYLCCNDLSELKKKRIRNFIP